MNNLTKTESPKQRPFFDHLLIPTDGSEISVEAANLGLRIAALHGAVVTLLHVLDPEVLASSAILSDRSEEKIRERMRNEGQIYLDQLEELAKEKDLDVTRSIREGTPHQEIIGLADEIGADLIVMGHAGRRGPRRKIAGSVAERVIRFANCPVLISRKAF